MRDGLNMPEGYGFNRPDERPAASIGYHQALYSEAPPENVNGPISPGRQMDPYSQASRSGHLPSYGQSSPYDQMSPQRYVWPPPHSYRVPNGQVYQSHLGVSVPAHQGLHIQPNGGAYGRPPLAGQYSHPMMASQDYMMSSYPNVSSAPPPTFHAGFSQRHDASQRDESHASHHPRHQGAQISHDPAPHLSATIASQSGSSGEAMAHCQIGRYRDRSFYDQGSTSSNNGEASSFNATTPNDKVEEPCGDDTLLLRTIAQGARALAGLQDEPQQDQKPVDQQVADEQRMCEQSALEQPLMRQPVSEHFKAGQVVSQQQDVGIPALHKAADQPSATRQPTFQPEKNKERQKEVDSTTSTNLSLDMPTMDSDKEDGDDCNNTKLDDGSQARSTTPESQPGISMLDKYAFNFKGEAYDHNVPQQHTEGITIHVGGLAPITTSLKQRRDEAHDDLVPPLIPSRDEFQKGQKTIECVWIGLLPSPAASPRTPSKIGEGSSKKPGGKRMKQTLTVSDMRADELKIIDFDKNALRVVAKKSEKITKDTHIYALLRPSHTGSLQGFKIISDKVFFFRKFRDDAATGALPRKQATIAKIRATIFPGSLIALSPSPTPTNGESSSKALNTMAADSPISDLSTMATPTPPPGFGPTSPTLPDDDGFACSAPSSSDANSSKKGKGKEKGKGGSIKSNKRKAQDPLVDVLMEQRNKARRKAKTEGYYVSPSDSEMYESVEDNDQGSPASHAENGDKSLMERASSRFTNVDEHIDPSLAAVENPVNVGSEENDDEEAYPEHAVDAQDPNFLSHTDDLIDKLARVDLRAKKTKMVSFRDHNGRMIDQNGKVTNYVGTSEGQSSHALQTESSDLAEKIKDWVDELATRQDVAGLQQALNMVQCIQNRRGPPKSCALSVYFNVPSSKDILIEDCAEQLKQLRALFQGVSDHSELQDHVLAWMAKGLQITGQSLSIDILHPYLIAFAEQYKAKFGGISGRPNNSMSRDVLVDMICCARDKAEKTLQLTAIERGASRDRSSMGAGDGCPSHPYVDRHEDFIFQPAFWEHPGE